MNDKDLSLKISIITATLNDAYLLERAIRSVIDQTYENIEYIIVDGGSNDCTVDIIKQYELYIAKWISEPDRGIYDAFNKGVNLASGDIIYFLNADDYLYDPNVIAELVIIFEKNPLLKLVYGNTIVFIPELNHQYIRGKAFSLDDLKTGDMPPHQGFFVKKELIKKVGLFDTQYQIAGDYDFIIRCFKEARDYGYYINRIIAVFQEGGISTSPAKQHLMNEEQQQIIKNHFGIDQVSNLQLQEVNGLYKVWLENLLINKKGITHLLHDYQITNVVIYGTLKTALFLYQDLKEESINIVCFLDNNQNMQGQLIEEIPIYDPEWLFQNQDKLDLIILSIEGQHDIGIMEDLKSMIGNDCLRICTWKELVKGKLLW